MSNSNDMAFPVEDTDLTPNNSLQTGLTKREYAAIKIMAGFAADPTNQDYRTTEAWERGIAGNAVAAVKWADALLIALETTPAARSASDAS